MKKNYYSLNYVLAVCTLLTMLILVLVGGMVTGTDAGMSVPDWPTTFGENMFLYPIDRMVSGLLVSIPNHLANDLDRGVMTEAVQNSVSVDENHLSEMAKIRVVKPGEVWKITDSQTHRSYTILSQDGQLGVYVHGVLLEHSHRLLGSLVGLLAIATLVSVWLSNQQGLLRWLSVLSLITVVIQGILGGLRVTENSIALAIVHASFAPISLAFFTILAMLTSRKSYQQPNQMLAPESNKISRLSIFTSILIYVQLVLGAVVRHTTQYLVVHVLIAILVAMHIVLLVRRVFSDYSSFANFINLSMIMGTIIVLQMTLGIGSWYSEFQLGERLSIPLRTAITSGHQFLGVFLFMNSLIFSFEVIRYTAAGKVDGSKLKIPNSARVQSTT